MFNANTESLHSLFGADFSELPLQKSLETCSFQKVKFGIMEVEGSHIEANISEGLYNEASKSKAGPFNLLRRTRLKIADFLL